MVSRDDASGATARSHHGTRDPAALAGGLGRGFPPSRAALVAYVMAAYPDRAASLDALRAVAKAGADVIEIGVPYADPLADGPTIQAAAKTARAATPGGFGLKETVELAARFIADPGVEDAPPVALMTYFNPMLRLGLAEVARRSRAAGVAGFIVPDLPCDSAAPWLEVADGLDTVFLVAPTSTPERIAMIAQASRGFVYCVSSLGVTGERSELPAGLADLVARVKGATTLPVAVGFGVGTPAQGADVARIADGVVVGSAIVRRQKHVEELPEFVSALAAAVRAP